MIGRIFTKAPCSDFIRRKFHFGRVHGMNENNLASLSLPTLAQRRDHLSLCYFYKLALSFPGAPLTHNTRVGAGINGHGQ